MKNNKKKFLLLSFILFIFNSNLSGEEFNISAKEILIDKENQIIIGMGSVLATDSEGKRINANKITYEKSIEFLSAEGDVKITDINGNILKANKATYDKVNELIITNENTQVLIEDGYLLKTKNISYDIKERIISSNYNSIFTDKDGNIIETSMFRYNVENNLFSSVGKIKIIDVNKNKYFFKELHVDTKINEMIGSDVSVVLDQETFGVSKENDPRFSANDIFVSKNKTNLSKGIFTICKKEDGKCPPWSMKAKKIRHDKLKKTIYYNHATLKLYDIPIFYFPYFFHPDPTVKRQSGFLIPTFSNSTNVGSGFSIPYFWAVNKDRDLTFTPKIFKNENPILLSEYRQEFKNGFLTLDGSYTEGYKNNSKTKTKGSRNHLFANFDIDLSKNLIEDYDSNLSIKLQRTSNDTYFRAHDINTALVNSERTDLESEIEYNFSKEDTYLDIKTSVYEDLRVKKKSDRYEFILPNVMYGKTFFTEKLGAINLQSSAFYNNYETNKHETFLTNDVIWSPSSYITSNGFINSVQGMARNTNYETKRVKEYKNNKTVNELSGVITHKTSLPLKKKGVNFNNLFSPNLMLRYAPGSMRDLSDNDTSLNYTNLYALNKTQVIEDGMSAIIGFDFKVNEKKSNSSEKEKFSVSLGQIFNYKENTDLPSKSSMDQKMSDVVGEVNYNFSEIGKINYKFALDHNYNDLNYNEITTNLNFGKFDFNLDYLEQRNHVGNEHYVSTGLTLNINENSKLGLSTKKNFKTESTELYDISYQYAIDCLTAGLVYRREFYQDDDSLEPNDSLMFTITFVPFSGFKAPIK